MFKVTEYFFFMAWRDELAPLLSYVVEVDLRAEELNERGRVLDVDELKAFGEYVTSRCDHRHLNRQFGFPPTAENLTRHFFEWIDGTQDWPLAAVRVTEAGRTAEYGLAPEPPVIVWADHSRQLVTHVHNFDVRIDPRALEMRKPITFKL